MGVESKMKKVREDVRDGCSDLSVLQNPRIWLSSGLGLRLYGILLFQNALLAKQVRSFDPTTARQHVGRRLLPFVTTDRYCLLSSMSESAINRVPIELWQLILHLLFFLDFDEAEIPSWGTWRRRKAQYDITAGYHFLCGERARLRLVNRCWNELVDQLPSTWVRLRTTEGPALSFKSISLFLSSIPLPARVMPLLRRHTIQTLSLCEAGSATHIFPEVTKNAHALAHLQALHVSLRGCSADNTVIRLVAAFAQNLVTLRLTVPILTIKSPPDLQLPKLRRLRVDCDAELSYVNLGVPRWSLPSIQWLEIPSLSFPGVEPKWAPQIQTLVLRSASLLHTDGLWSRFSTLRTIKVQLGSTLSNSLLPGPDSSARELVVCGQLCSLNASLPVLQAFVEAARTLTELSQVDGNSGCAQRSGKVDGRKVILEGVDWAAPGFLREDIMISCAQWEKIAPFLEDERGVSWLKAKTCFAHFRRKGDEDQVDREPVKLVGSHQDD